MNQAATACSKSTPPPASDLAESGGGFFFGIAAVCVAAPNYSSLGSKEMFSFSKMGGFTRLLGELEVQKILSKAANLNDVICC